MYYCAVRTKPHWDQNKPDILKKKWIKIGKLIILPSLLIFCSIKKSFKQILIIMGSHQHLINHDFYNIPNLFVDLRSQEDFFDMTLATTEQIKNQFKAHKGGLILDLVFTLAAEISKTVPNQYPP